MKINMIVILIYIGAILFIGYFLGAIFAFIEFFEWIAR